jgi:hypothetical protein
MAYLGRALTSGNYLKLDDISSQFNGSLTTFNLTSGGQAFYPGSPYSILVSLAGVIQEPESAYTINENQITFATAPAALDDFFCIVLGVALGIGVPGDGTVTEAKLAAGIRGVGISSAGTQIGVGITQLNFIGAGNTFALNGTTVDVSIAGGGGGGGGTVSGIATGSGTDGVTLVGIGTTVVTGAGNSEGALQVYGNVALVDGAVLTDQNINQNVFIPSGKNGLLIGPVTVGVGLTVDIASGSVLVVV